MEKVFILHVLIWHLTNPWWVFTNIRSGIRMLIYRFHLFCFSFQNWREHIIMVHVVFLHLQ